MSKIKAYTSAEIGMSKEEIDGLNDKCWHDICTEIANAIDKDGLKENNEKH